MSGRSRRSARWPSRSRTWSQPMPYPEMYPPEDPTTTRLAVARTMFLDRVDADVADDDPRAGLEARTRRCASPSCGCWAAPWPASRPTRRRSRTGPAGSWSTSPPSTRARGQAGRARRWVDDFARRAAQDDDGAYVNFLGDEGEARIRAAYPGRHLGAAGGDQGALRPDNLFRLNQNIPPAASRPGWRPGAAQAS